MADRGAHGPVNAMTVDVEDWFQVQAFAGTIARNRWDTLQSRVEANTDRILAMFADAGVQGTFFTLGWVAARHPALVRRIVAGGHELASHGYWHQLAHGQTPEMFAEDVGSARKILEDTGGVAVHGYRAPTFSIDARNPWAFDVLAEQGYAYSSSIYPIRHDLYGMPAASRVPFRPEGAAGPAGIVELPMTTVRLAGRNLPCAGGGYFRLLPYAVYRAGLRRFNRSGPGMFYTHPWELDAGQPRVEAAPAMAKFRHYLNLGEMPHRMKRLLQDFHWGRMDTVFANEIKAGGVRGEWLHSTRLIGIMKFTAYNEAAWDNFVLTQADATFFHRSQWKTVIEKAFGHRTHYLMAEQDGAIVGVLPLAQVKTRLFGHTLIGLPFCVYGGPLAVDAATAHALSAQAAALGQKLGAAATELRFLNPPGDGVLDETWQARSGLYVTFRRAITASDDANLKAIPRKQRAMVRKGIDRGLTATVDRNVDLLHGIYAESVRNLGTPVFGRRYFRLLAEAFGSDLDVTTVHDAGVPVASVMNFHWRDEVVPYYGGGTAAARGCFANDFLYWSVMRQAASRGATLFDFGRSKQGTGAYAFKKNWGFEPAPLSYYFNVAEGRAIPENNPLNPKYRLMIAAWKRLPLPVANMLGPMLVRGVG